MADIYKSVAGAVVRSQAVAPSFISIEGLDFEGSKLLLTSISITKAQEVQFLKTLGKLYYIYAFGESPGSVQIGGLLFFTGCESKNGAATNTGIADVLRFYEESNAYAKGSPIRISGGGVSFRCILNGMAINGDMNAYNYASFSLSFTIIPEK